MDWDKELWKYKKERENHYKSMHGNFLGPLLILWEDALEWIDEEILFRFYFHDIVWWITDGEPHWSDAVPCDRWLCMKCGTKPFKKKKHE